MSNNMKNVLVVGTGEIAGEYCKILRSMGIFPDVVGRNQDKAKEFSEKYGVNAVGGGLDAYLSKNEKCYEYAIVATDVLSLGQNTYALLSCGVPNILVEKPAGMDKAEIEAVSNLADKNGAKVYVAYNRRFYASTNQALKIIKADGGVKSFSFEFTEWAHVITKLEVDDKVKNNWFLANSTHVVDLAFFLGGEPKNMANFVAGGLEWHKNGCIYAGAGTTFYGALFSYQANWASPGRWSVEILTKSHRLYFKPMERLGVQNLGSLEVNFVEIDDEIDLKFKPGFYKEVESFINKSDDGKKKIIQDQLRYMQYFDDIEGK